ncbi:hypothetical protein ACJ73_08792 [Blastomyces percursus]|uniref:Uncharacterized protein n=1 Tax=Blastomyces percursus TaxID=1658174 RepID=A0A1J9QMY8_9EURO|nr:hypothetical protein ACJ73_08792 [Blastomyces percursus]
MREKLGHRRLQNEDTGDTSYRADRSATREGAGILMEGARQIQAPPDGRELQGKDGGRSGTMIGFHAARCAQAFLGGGFVPGDLGETGEKVVGGQESGQLSCGLKMKPLRSPYVEFVDLTGGSDEEAGNLSNTSCEAPAAYDGNQDAKAPGIDETTANSMILRPFVSPLHETVSVSQEPGVGSATSTELASPIQEHVIWEKPIRGRLEHVNTGGCVNSLRLVILPLEDGYDSLWRASDKSPAIAALGVGTNSIPDCPIQPGESRSNCNTLAPPGTISPSSLPLSTDPVVGSTRVSFGRVVLPQGVYSSPSGCCATRLSLRVARRALEVCASEIDRFGGCEFQLQQNLDGSQVSGISMCRKTAAMTVRKTVGWWHVGLGWPSQ